MATILVVDDERLLCDLLQEMLRRHGHEVVTAYSGREGIALHKEQRPHFTLLDLHLPDMTGIEVLARIRENDPQDRKSTRLNSSHIQKSRMPSSA